jgi:hypothetical protein
MKKTAFSKFIEVGVEIFFCCDSSVVVMCVFCIGDLVSQSLSILFIKELERNLSKINTDWPTLRDVLQVVCNITRQSLGCSSPSGVYLSTATKTSSTKFSAVQTQIIFY